MIGDNYVASDNDEDLDILRNLKDMRGYLKDCFGVSSMYQSRGTMGRVDAANAYAKAARAELEYRRMNPEAASLAPLTNEDIQTMRDDFKEMEKFLAAQYGLANLGNCNQHKQEIASAHGEATLMIAALKRRAFV